MDGGGVALPLTPADSVRLAAHAYSSLLLATLPLAIAIGGALACRTACSKVRSLIWRAATIALLVVYVGRAQPVQWFAWSLPDRLSTPLVELGVLQLAVSEGSSSPSEGLGPGAIATALPFVLIVYWVGVALFLAPLVRTLLLGPGIARRAKPLRNPHWEELLATLRGDIGVRRPIQLLLTSDPVAPRTWGVLRPTILLPLAVMGWSRQQQRAVLLHELAHVRRRDPLFLLLSRISCALFWFHPGVWWVARALAAESELSCDACVLAHGVRRSDYAELLLLASSRFRGLWPLPPAGAALVAGGGLRDRLMRIVSPEPLDRPVPRRIATLVASAVLATAPLVSSVQLMPSRRTLTTLMADSHWASRAYAATGLAQRRDSVDVARAAAATDPNPRVRAWARFALAQPSGRDLLAILSKQH
ncbi:MAG: hypothetical protein MNPFHGCM_02456 [Gemmatimonadaceae bacterium]|nr:hypothetical protein [Gemmatimonadaceae bacterium]